MMADNITQHVKFHQDQFQIRERLLILRGFARKWCCPSNLLQNQETAHVNPRTRDDFDRNLERVLDRLPAAIRRLLDDVPLHVEDYPSADVLEQTGVARREWLCGLYTGIPLTERSVEQSRPAPDVVTLYREGILHLTADADGYVNERALQRQIRITLLHELGHHHGLTEEDLNEMGYG